MAIDVSEVKKYLSGGASNSIKTDSRGGAISSVEVVDNTLHNLFPEVPGSESLPGIIKYLCIYIKNTDGALTMKNVRFYLSQLSTSTNHEYAIGLGSAGLNAQEQGPLGSITTAPSSVTFSSPTTYGSGLAPVDIPFGQYYPLWIRETVDAAAAAKDDNTAILAIGYDTNE
jgi:hypothetical protein